MAYASRNFKTKKAFKEAVVAGEKITLRSGLYGEGLGGPYVSRTAFVEGPWYPQPHSWYAQVEVDASGFVTRVK